MNYKKFDKKSVIIYYEFCKNLKKIVVFIVGKKRIAVFIIF